MAVALLVAGDRFLLTSRDPGRVGGGTWELPGGKLAPGEGPEAALRRELAEELGLTVGRATAYPAYHYHDASYAVVLYPFRFEAFPDEPVGREGQSLRWVAAAELSREAKSMPAANAGLIDHLRSQGALQP